MVGRLRPRPARLGPPKWAALLPTHHVVTCLAETTYANETLWYVLSSPTPIVGASQSASGLAIQHSFSPFVTFTWQRSNIPSFIRSLRELVLSISWMRLYHEFASL